MLSIILILLYYIRKDSANGRLFIWKNTIEMIQDHPITGVGIGKFKSAFPSYQAAFYKYQSDSIDKYYDGNCTFAFNEILEQYAEMGIISILIVFIFIWNLKKSKKSHASYAYLWGIVNFFIFSCFSYPYSVFTLLITFLFLVSSVTRHTPIIHIGKPSNCFKMEFAIISLAIIFISLQSLSTVYHWKSIQDETYSSNKVRFYQEYYPYFQDNIFYILDYYGVLKDKDYSEEKLHLLDKAIARIPLSGWYLLRANLYMEMKEWEKAEEDFIFLTHLTPTSLEPIYKLALLYSMTSKKDSAILLIDKAIKEKKFKENLNNKMLYYEMKKIRINLTISPN